MVPWWVWAIVVLLIILLLGILKKVVVATLTVTVSKDLSYRGDTQRISGDVKVGATPQSGKTVAMAITPPSGDVYSLPNVTTDANGLYAADWLVPITAVNGVHTLTVTCMGVQITKTFTRISRRKV